MPIRDEKHMEEQRQRISRAAFRCFSKLGYQKTTIKAICEESGLSVGAIYTHFKDRNEILMSMKSMTDDVPLEEQSFDSWSDLSAHLLALFDFDARPENLDYIVCDLKLMAESFGNDQLAVMINNARKTTGQWTKRCLQELVNAGEIELPLGIEKTARAIGYLVSGAMMTVVMDDRKERIEAARVLKEALNALVCTNDE